jgi:hypothetical protein
MDPAIARTKARDLEASWTHFQTLIDRPASPTNLSTFESAGEAIGCAGPVLSPRGDDSSKCARYANVTRPRKCTASGLVSNRTER